MIFMILFFSLIEWFGVAEISNLNIIQFHVNKKILWLTHKDTNLQCKTNYLLLSLRNTEIYQNILHLEEVYSLSSFSLW